jgi:hypothetical protein
MEFPFSAICMFLHLGSHQQILEKSSPGFYRAGDVLRLFQNLDQFVQKIFRSEIKCTPCLVTQPDQLRRRQGLISDNTIMKPVRGDPAAEIGCSDPPLLRVFPICVGAGIYHHRIELNRIRT